MSLNPGEITSTDLSPNAQILGTQIADNTIQLRNLTDDTFRVVAVKTGTIPSFTVSNPGAGNFGTNLVSITIPHNLGYVPAILGYATNTAGDYLLSIPWSTNSGSGTTASWTTLYYTVDNTNIYAYFEATAYGNTTYSSGGTWPVKFYLLQERASIT